MQSLNNRECLKILQTLVESDMFLARMLHSRNSMNVSARRDLIISKSLLPTRISGTLLFYLR